MRVISGKCRGTQLMAPEGMETRPTTDRIKETLFNMIAFDLPECRFLDLFSGSGGIGIESLSRGAEHAVFVDQGDKALACIRGNLEKTRLVANATVMGMNVMEAVKRLGSKKERFDIIFMDPPYALEGIDQIIEAIEENGLLNEEGYIILERSSKTIVKLPQNLVLWKEKQYKTTTLSFIKKG
ncbi:MAG: 16S rRNA (guanine(966)-N(2))-methyltransferase RsmD [Cellulosilyticum sp.]|nr:16S rRNA (guanine(966)-N(2))-methyltransferase RsmD [Cellulosilyticum sp.]